ncbi:MAG TPA: YwiC-like family protein [Thermoanaerobaculia bacterium]|nr:YwiC-like family protein [Thermoanaerobaculia bacterium]
MTTVALNVPHPKLRPIALPTEHGGWGLLFEPLVIALAIRPSAAGALLAGATIFAFLARQPLKLALQDSLRGRSSARTRYCRLFAAMYLVAAAIALGAAVKLAGTTLLIPVGLVIPLALTTILFDANHRSRDLLPELCGTVAMSSSAAAVAIAGGMRVVPALALSAIVLARAIPSVVYVRTLLRRAHGRAASSWPVLLLHGAAVVTVSLFAPPLVTLAMAMLLVRAIWGLTHVPPRAQTIGWREVGYGVATIALVVAGHRWR